MANTNLLLVVGLIGVTGWFFREPLMQRINPPPEPVANTADLAPADSRYKQSGAGQSDSGIYSWRDKDGNMHYGTRPDAEGAAAVTLSKGNTVSLGGRPEEKKKPTDSKASGGAKGENPVERTRNTVHSPAMQQQAELGAMEQVMQ
jgi:hypothetical protein